MTYIALALLYLLKILLEETSVLRRVAARRAVIFIEVLIIILYFAHGGLELTNPPWLVPVEHEFLLFML